MKTHAKLSPDELKVFTLKASIKANHHLFNDCMNYVFNNVTDTDTLQRVYDMLENYIDSIDLLISNTLNNEPNN